MPRMFSKGFTYMLTSLLKYTDCSHSFYFCYCCGFNPRLMYAKHTLHLRYIHSSYFISFLPNMKSGHKRDQITCLRPHSQLVAHLGFKPRQTTGSNLGLSLLHISFYVLSWVFQKIIAPPFFGSYYVVYAGLEHSM